MFPSERQEQQVLRAATTGPSSIRLTWRIIQSSRGYRLEWREGEGQMCMSLACSNIHLSFLFSFCTCIKTFCSFKKARATWSVVIIMITTNYFVTWWYVLTNAKSNLEKDDVDTSIIVSNIILLLILFNVCVETYRNSVLNASSTFNLQVEGSIYW